MLTKDGGRELAYKHPWLYHYVWKANEETRTTVASDGLVSGKSRRYWHPTFLPRPGHVYLATHAYLTKAAFWMRPGPKDDLYAIRTTALVPARVNPDEDHFSASYVGETTCDRFHLPRPLGVYYRDRFGDAVPSFGDWADQVNLGSDPAHVAHSVNAGSVAYEGVVPPHALRRWDATKKVWVSDLVGSAP